MSTSMAVRPGLGAERTFFTTMAVVILISTLIGFAPTYYLRSVIPPLHPYDPLSTLAVVHGVVFSAWILLFVAQTSLVAAGRLRLHQKLGLASTGLIVLMVPLAILMALGAPQRPFSAPPGIDLYSFMAVPLLDIPVFVGLIVAALLNRRDGKTHKRLMLIAMVDMMQPSVGRMPFPPPSSLYMAIPFLIPLIIWDFKTRGRLHPATAWGSALVAGVILLRPAIWSSPAWLAFAHWAGGLIA